MIDKIIEYDKRIVVPEFKGWEEREIKAMCKCTWPACNNLSNCKNKQ